MSAHLCINCWRQLGRREQLYRCPRCAADGSHWLARGDDALRPVEELAPPWYRRLMAADDGELACPDHPDAALSFHCPCGAPISPASVIERGRPLGLGFAGPRSAGKTLLTITMVNRLFSLEIERWRIGLAGLDETERRFHELSSQLLDRRGKPAATRPEEEGDEELDARTPAGAPNNFCWRLSLDDPSRKRAAPPLFLALYDVAGETWGLPPSERRPRFERYLELVGSLVFVVDGAALATDLGLEVDDAWDDSPRTGERGWADRQWLQLIADRLGKRARQVDVALVVSKADHLWRHPDWAGLRPASPSRSNGSGNSGDGRTELLEDALRCSQRLGLLTQARGAFRRVEPFAVSSLGFAPGPDDVDPEGRLTRDVDPLGVTAPLVWLLRQKLAALKR